MSAEEKVQHSQALLELMAEELEAVIEALDPAGQDQVMVKLRELAEQASGVEDAADLLRVADAVRRLVERTPALAALLLLPSDMIRSSRPPAARCRA